MSHLPFIALTDEAWFEFLSSRAVDGQLDEVNFWSPRARMTMKRFRPGEPLFFRLKKPHHCIVGYGFFAHFCVLGLHEAWSMFREKNGDPDYLSFLTRIGSHRGIDLLDPRSPHEPLGCTILRDAVFWPRERWLPWRDEQRWPLNTQRGRSVNVRAALRAAG